MCRTGGRGNGQKRTVTRPRGLCGPKARHSWPLGAPLWAVGKSAPAWQGCGGVSSPMRHVSAGACAQQVHREQEPQIASLLLPPA